MELIVNFPDSDSHRPYERRVSFSNVEIYFVENLASKHKPDLWFSDYDMKKRKYQTTLSLKRIESADLTFAQFAEMNIQDTSTFMGLESFLCKSTPQNIRLRRRAVVQAVLLEQERQLEAGVCYPEKMASIVEADTAMSLRRAQIIAQLHMSN